MEEKQKYDCCCGDPKRFFFLKTAAVRFGVKPAELLRVRRHYKVCNSGGCCCCLKKAEILKTISLDNVELYSGADSSLFLFFRPERLAAVLSVPEHRELLFRHGYPAAHDLDADIEHLRRRFLSVEFPHEVGIFVGYPIKDVRGFIENQEPVFVHRGRWRVYGDPSESVRCMNIYRRAELHAAAVFDKYSGLQVFPSV